MEQYLAFQGCAVFFSTLVKKEPKLKEKKLTDNLFILLVSPLVQCLKDENIFSFSVISCGTTVPMLLSPSKNMENPCSWKRTRDLGFYSADSLRVQKKTHHVPTGGFK